MDQRIRTAFESLRHAHRKALIPFVMGADPDVRTTAGLIRALADAGADLIEVGIPFSDPVADGPIIQRASARALKRGATPPKILDMIRRVSREVSTPIVLLSYWNPIVQFGNGRAAGADPRPFVEAAVRAGVAGVIVPDLPPEEAEGFCDAAHRGGLATIFLASPTSSPARLRIIARRSQGFVYYVSLTGTTGVRSQLASELWHRVRQLKLITTKPICVGFGISTPAQAAAVAKIADGVIVSSALIRAIEPYVGNPRTMAAAAGKFLRGFRAVM